MRRSYFTIAEIMLVIAVAAIFLSAFEIVLQSASKADLKGHAEIRNLLILRAVCGVVIGAIMGFCMGITRRHRYWSGIVGFFEGGFIGGYAATILSFPECSLLMVIGAALLLAFGIVVRVLSRRTPKQEDALEG